MKNNIVKVEFYMIEKNNERTATVADKMMKVLEAEFSAGLLDI